MPHTTTPVWTLKLRREGMSDVLITTITDPFADNICTSKTFSMLEISFSLLPKRGYTEFKAEIRSLGPEVRCFFTLEGTVDGAEIYSFNGKAEMREVLRQSPHDPADHVVDIAKQAVPMVAIKKSPGYVVAMSDAPAFYENYTTQLVDPARGIASISSGDDGSIPGHTPRTSTVKAGYHLVSQEKTHTFEGLFISSDADTLQHLRADVFTAIAAKWGVGSDRLGAVSFSTNYMHLRRNETGNSRYWICPGIEYANKQYTRDAFWQSMVLPVDMEQECYDNEAVALSPGAERPLFTLIWSYRIQKRGGTADMEAARSCLEYVDEHSRDGFYYSNNDPERKDFQSWYDLCAFDLDDVISYNQGLLVVGLLAARELGLTPETSIVDAKKAYRSLYDTTNRYYPLSRKRDIVCLDALVGDLLAKLLFGTALLDSESVHETFETVMRAARTEHGYKVTCDLTGDFVETSRYSTTDFRSRQCDLEQGAYANGGAYYLYNMLFLIDCYLHDVPGAEEQIIWRTRIEFERGGTYHEYIDTVTGVPGKPNQGWNGAIYAMWRQLIDEDKATDRFLREIDAVDIS